MTPDERALSITLAIQTLHDKAAHLWHFAEHLTDEQRNRVCEISEELEQIGSRADLVTEPYERLVKSLEAAE